MLKHTFNKMCNEWYVKIHKFAAAMRKLFFQGLKSLLLTALAAGIITSCQEEKPDFQFPDPVIPQKEFRHLESITPDTLTFMEHDSAVFRVRTIPYNYLSRDSLTIQIADGNILSSL